MKKMIYTKERGVLILDKGETKRFKWVIINRGTHPTAYIGIPKTHPYYNKPYDTIDIRCHGGLTFAEKDFNFNPIDVKNIWWVGWDYSHGDDYAGYFDENKQIGKGRKWTTDEIRKEVMNVIKQLSIQNIVVKEL